MINTSNNNNINNNNIENSNQEKLLLIQRKLALMVKEKEKEINDLKLELIEKDKEIKKLRESNNSIKNNEIAKINSLINNNSDFAEIKKNFDKENNILKEEILKYQNEILNKNEIINKLNDELNSTRNLLENERKNNMKFLYFQNKNEETLREKFNKMTNDITIFQNNEENFNNKILYLEKENQKIKEEKNFIEKNFEDSEINNKNIIFNLQNSYSIILNDYQKLSEIFDKKQKELSDISSEKINIQKDLKNYQNNFITIQKENINLKSENDGYKKRLNTYEYEVGSLKKEIKNLEEIIKQNKFSKRIFKVNYVYMGMTLTAIIIIEKEKNNKYIFKIENRTSTRKFNLLDLEINQIDNNKIVIKFLKDNTQEEYITKEAKIICENFYDFKQKVIEVSDSLSEAKSLAENEEKIAKTREKLNNFLNM